MKPSIPDVLDAFKAYFRRHPTWGALHGVLDDGNVHDDHVKDARRSAIVEGDTDGARLANILLQMSRTQRHKIARIARVA